MDCTCRILSDSASGRILLYGDVVADKAEMPDHYNIALQFNNITQWLCYEDFLALEWNVRAIDTTAYFDAHPYEERIHLSTPSRFLTFSFRLHELIELRKMLSRAVARLHWFETLRKTQN
ncbi:hypothetical protein EXU85_04190 [Spirosoma sp. KCTC 42546]|uniref:hypothetical protein n=1 Tax=Spirosoma sp. KCTC 42546 TaxID=2520506 RepID=UPI00115AD3B6|nr:hypothetical protein [Spirosoma sp. KCTC 42546]QDK77833.1 hypothetical protein EXU85_04190 [Spirosoma sp. KCTC 42546]